MTSEEYGQYIDDFELGADVMPGESLTEYIERRRREFESKADGGSIGIEVLFTDKEPRTEMVSGGFLKSIGAGLGNLFKGGKDKIDDIIETKAMEKVGFRSRDDIPLSTYSEMKGPIKLSDMENIPEDQLKKILRTQELGLYEETPELLKAANLLERFTKKVKGKRVIDYERAEAILGVKLKGNETLDDLFKIEFETRPENRLADGGRVGLFMGGDPLTGQALQIYNSMKNYNFSDQEIADALSARGLYTPAGSGTTQPEQVTGIIGSQLNQGGGDKPMIRPFREDPRVGSAFEAYQRNQALSAMGINDPFANEATLAGAYYDDMPNVDLSPGKQTLGGAIKSGVSKVLNYPLIQGMSLMTPVGVGKEILKGLGSLFPVNQRAIAENVAGNMGIAVDDIGRIVNTGNYADPDNIMAGYNLNLLTDKSFDKRIDRTSKTLSEKYGLGANEIKGILEGTLTDEELANINAKALMPGTKKTTNLIKQLRSLNIAKDRNKFIQETARKEAERQELERALKRAQREIKRQGYTDYGSGGGRDTSLNQGPGGSYTGMGDQGATGANFSGDFATDAASYDLKDGGPVGLATMFTRRR